MHRPSYISRYRCPACGQSVNKLRQHYWQAASWYVHASCRPQCTICGEDIEPPAIGLAHTVTAWLNGPAHASCKEKD